MALKSTNFATATDTQIIMMTLALMALSGDIGGTVLNPPASVNGYQIDTLRPMLFAELYKRGLACILTLNAMP
jgi:hypothetical protein